MPEMQFLVRWPDETVSSCYSPSLVIRDYFEVGTSYALDDFVERSRTALTIASSRILEKYGHPCSAAESQLSAIEVLAETFAGRAGATVTVEAFDPPA